MSAAEAVAARDSKRATLEANYLRKQRQRLHSASSASGRLAAARRSHGGQFADFPAELPGGSSVAGDDGTLNDAGDDAAAADTITGTVGDSSGRGKRTKRPSTRYRSIDDDDAASGGTVSGAAIAATEATLSDSRTGDEASWSPPTGSSAGAGAGGADAIGSNARSHLVGVRKYTSSATGVTTFSATLDYKGTRVSCRCCSIVDDYLPQEDPSPITLPLSRFLPSPPCSTAQTNTTQRRRLAPPARRC
jgi:hypothetical protein